ncbi:hypothetical protein SAMN05444392_10329 [Seinonella peptonophila]|uniref:YtpI-like protein n=1 Tax=Seinonella peptonophila TaxID=112248 RepID=A0A1M4W4I6_9BACL|nr:hypothetical protein [Seinonella peptonophila]SHE76107.1 hypothetical protein SAMN05444392_10329 [Seinonella peptonophila]
MITIQFFSVVLIIITFFSVIYHSWLMRSRRKHQQAFQQPLAIMNMSMGLLFLAISIFLITFPGAWYRYLLIALIAGIGMINLYYGVQRYRWQKRTSQSEK